MLVGVDLNAACSLINETVALGSSLVLLASLSLELLDLSRQFRCIVGLSNESLFFH